MLRQYSVPTLILFSLALALGIAGCTSSPPPPAPTAEKAAEPRGEEHAHKPGSHGGSIVSIGRDNYHAEAIFEKGGVLRLLMLGKDESRLLEVESQTLTAYAKPDGGTGATAFTLKPEPQAGDAPGTTSQFVGTLPRELWGRPAEVTIPVLKIGAERFRVGPITSEAPAGGHAAMPAQAEGDEERTLYLTPAGRYTEADIEANGRQVASEKFKGQFAAHDLKPQPGDPVCPVTLTKANPKFTWVVGGKTYTFCCPPCVDEFVRQAREQPETIRPPEEYVKK